jgi:hypothetical protein
VDKEPDAPVPARLLTFTASEWHDDETKALRRWLQARRTWAAEHGWPVAAETRVLQEQHVAGQVLTRRLAACTSEADHVAVLQEHHAEHGGELRRLRDRLWQHSLALTSRSGNPPR